MRSIGSSIDQLDDDSTANSSRYSIRYIIWGHQTKSRADDNACSQTAYCTEVSAKASKLQTTGSTKVFFSLRHHLKIYYTAELYPFWVACPSESCASLASVASERNHKFQSSKTLFGRSLNTLIIHYNQNDMYIYISLVYDQNCQCWTGITSRAIKQALLLYFAVFNAWTKNAFPSSYRWYLQTQPNTRIGLHLPRSIVLVYQ